MYLILTIIHSAVCTAVHVAILSITFYSIPAGAHKPSKAVKEHGATPIQISFVVTLIQTFAALCGFACSF